MKGFRYLLLGFLAAVQVLALGGLASLAQGPQAPGPKVRTVTIGFTWSQHGQYNVESSRQMNGFQLWLDQVNAAGGVKLPDGTTIMFKAIFYDDESSKERVQELYTKIISADRADFLISPYSSGLTDAAAIIAQQYKKIMITAGAASDSTYKKGYTLVFQTYTPASRYLVGALDLLSKLDPEAKKIAIVHENDKFSTDVATALKKYAESRGFQVALFEAYDKSTPDFAPFINKIPPDVAAVLGGGHFADTSTFTRQMYEKGLKAKLIALLVAPPEPEFAEIGAAAEGVMGPSQWEPVAGLYSQEAAKTQGVEWYGPTVEEFIRAYQAKYKKDPSYHSAGGYVAGLLLQRAIEKAGATDTEKVKAALDAMDIYTFYGRIKFDTTPKSHGLQIGHEMVYIQWQRDPEGKLVKKIVWPEVARNAEPKYPLR